MYNQDCQNRNEAAHWKDGGRGIAIKKRREEEGHNMMRNIRKYGGRVGSGEEKKRKDKSVRQTRVTAGNRNHSYCRIEDCGM